MQTRQRILEPCPALGTLRSLIDLAKQAPADGIRRDPLLEVDRLVLVRKPLRRPAVVQVTLRIHPQGPPTSNRCFRSNHHPEKRRKPSCVCLTAQGGR